MSAEAQAAASVAQSIFGFKGNRALAKQAEQFGEFQAKQEENDLLIKQRATRQQEASLRQASERLKGTQNVVTAASGIQMSGSPLEAMKDTYLNTEIDAQRIQYAGSIEEANSLTNAAIARVGGKARAAGLRLSAISSLIGGGSAMAQYNQNQTLLGQRQAAFDSQVEFQNRMLEIEQSRYERELG